MTRADRLRSGACYCPDDRCIGYHHGADEPCGCTIALAGTADEGMLSSRVQRA